jgi:hypothetical protein
MFKAILGWAAGVCLLINLPADAVSSRIEQGGGVAYPSWTAEYFDNATLSGEPAWTKFENRIWFEWEDWRPILGIHAESVTNFPTDYFSVRFSGTLVPRYSQTYALKLVSDEQARRDSAVYRKLKVDGSTQRAVFGGNLKRFFDPDAKPDLKVLKVGE